MHKIERSQVAVLTEYLAVAALLVDHADNHRISTAAFAQTTKLNHLLPLEQCTMVTWSVYTVRISQEHDLYLMLSEIS